MARRKAETPPHEVPVVRIFISSPGDVAKERTFARQFIDSELPKLPPFREKVKVELIAWDDPAARIPMLATETPQDSVNAARPRPANCDIVIVILWSRMGTPLPNSVRKPNNERYLSGTEWEYEDAINSPQRPRPEVLVYRRTEEPTVKLDDLELADKQAQFQHLKGFFAQFRNVDGSLKGGVNEYSTLDEFKTLLSQQLQDLLWRRLSPSRDDGETSPVTATIPPAYLAWLQRTYPDVDLLGQDLHKGQTITLNHVYVPALTRPAAAPDARQSGRQKPRTSPEDEPQGDQKSIPLLQRLDQESLYVPAPAGAGKSTFCRWAALQSITSAAIAHPVPAPADFAEPVPATLRGRLPLLVPLREFWTRMDCGRGQQTWHRADLERALAAWVDDQLSERGLTGDLLRAHLDAGTTFLLLDGLDEVPASERREATTVYPRSLLLSGLADVWPDWREKGNRMLLTSRPYGLDEAGLHRLGLPSTPLEPLPVPLQHLFITRWFHTLGKAELTQGLIETIRGRTDLAPLTENPMMLTALCVLYESGGRLPEDRYDLYRRIVNTVLIHRFPGDAREREPVKARLEAIALGMHTGAPGSPRASPAPEISHLEIEHLLRTFAAEGSFDERGRVEPAAQREELLTRSGLLLPQPNDRAAFYHLSLQEFLAAERILRMQDDLWPIFHEHAAVAAWRLTLMFLFAGKIAAKTPRWGLDLLHRLIREETRAAVRANPAPAVFISEALDLCLKKRYAISEELKECFRQLALDAIADEIDLRARQALGLCLGWLGDPRIPDLRNPAAYVEVPAGTYPYGDGGKTVAIAAPVWIGRYLVTNGQYQAFIGDEGYHERRWWSESGWAWRQAEGVIEPAFWRDQHWSGPNQPVVGVSFWEAEACSRWAGGRLPQEEEWEAAARGPEGFTFPWGNNWQDGICNTVESGSGGSSPVGLFPHAHQARLGIEDLAGNVDEWCGSLYYPSDIKDPNAFRVLRGGSWSSARGDARCAARIGSSPGLRFDELGFRVLCSSPPSFDL